MIVSSKMTTVDQEEAETVVIEVDEETLTMSALSAPTGLIDLVRGIGRTVLSVLKDLTAPNARIVPEGGEIAR